MARLISDKYEQWEKLCESRFETLKENEEKLNAFFIGLYGMQAELTPEVDDSEITISRADLTRDIKSLLSYAVGCLFGRYSLDRDGLCYAGGKWDPSAYKTIIPFRDNFIPINDIDGGLTKAVVSFIEKVYGSETLEQNLLFITSAIAGEGLPRSLLHSYLQKDFFNDHVKKYKGRPIYWQVTSGKKGAFRGLIYLHRYDPELPEIILNNYSVSRYEQLKNELKLLNERFSDSSITEKAQLRREINKYQSMLDEMNEFIQRLEKLAEQKISIDLDDGVKVNYSKLKDILQPL